MKALDNLKVFLREIYSVFQLPAEVEAAYQETSYPQSIFMMRIAIVLGASTHLSFFWLDALMFPDRYMGVWMMRFLVLLIFFVIIPLTFRPFFAKIHQAVIFWLLVIITFGQFYALILTNSTSGSTAYFTGLLLVIVCSYALSQLNLVNCLILSAIIMVGYLWVGVYQMGWIQEGWLSEKGLLLIDNTFFLFSMNVIGVVIYITIQYFRRKGFVAQLEAEAERKKAALERLRIKISSDLHDDVGSILSGLAMQAELLQQRIPETEKDKLNRLSELSRSAMSRMRDAVWAMDARKDKWESLQDRMREFAEETLDEKGISYQINFENLNLQEVLSAEIRQNLYLIFKEAITNVFKHSNATQVKVNLTNMESAFEMLIKDNGNTKDINLNGAGLGLSNIKLRASRLHAVLEFIQKDGFGILLRRKRIEPHEHVVSGR